MLKHNLRQIYVESHPYEHLMRLIGTRPTKEEAELLGDYLFTQNIPGRIQATDGGWALWIQEEDHRLRAKEIFDEFAREPEHPRYRMAAEEAERLRRQQERVRRRQQDNYVDLRARWEIPSGPHPVTLVLLIACIAVHFARWHSDPRTDRLHDSLMISAPGRSEAFLPEVRAGQVWRLITPIFLHGDWMHLIFNLLALRALGRVVEIRKSSVWLVFFVLASALCSNLAQYWWSGPNFVGFSGVVYALFGYAWMQSRHSPQSGIYVPPQTVFLAIVWFFLGVTGLLTNIANAAHAGGLGFGIVLGIVPYVRRRLGG